VGFVKQGFKKTQGAAVVEQGIGVYFSSTGNYERLKNLYRKGE
jgi:hypothetical protein